MALVKPARPPAGQAYLMVWSKPGRGAPYGAGSNELVEAAYHETQIGRAIDVWHRYFNPNQWTNTWIDSTTKGHDSAGRMLFLSFKTPSTSNSWVTTWKGGHDAIIDQHAAECIAFGKPMWAGFYGEADAKTGLGTNADFSKAYARFISRFTSAGATNVAWALNLTSGAYTNGDATAMDPANNGQQVDWNAPDGYNWYGRNSGDAWRTFQQVMQANVDWTNTHHPGMPICCGETQTMEDPANAARKGGWYPTIKTALQLTSSSWPDFDMIGFFNSYPPGDGAFVPNWYADSQPGEDNSKGYGATHPNWPTGWHYGSGASLTGYVSLVTDAIMGGGGSTGGSIPALTTPPTMTPPGTTSPSPGTSLVSGTGVWTNTPTSYTYQWQYRVGTTSTTWTTLAGSTTNTYALTSVDVGRQFRCQVTAHNAAGASAAKSSDYSGVVQTSNAPANTSAPTISDATPVVGEVVTVDVGSWTGTSPITYAYQWQHLTSGTPSAQSSDTFARTVAAGSWGAASTPGGAGSWVVGWVGTASNFAVDGTYGTIQLPSLSAVQQLANLPISPTIADGSVPVDFRISQVAAGTGADGHALSIQGRVQDTTNYYQARVEQKQDGTIQLQIRKVIAGAGTFLTLNGGASTAVNGTNLTAMAANTTYHARFEITGTTLRVRIWSGASEPSTWDATATDSAISAAGTWGVGALQLTNTTTSTAKFSIDNWSVTNISGGGVSTWVSATGTGNATASYTVNATDLGLPLRVLVTATNSVGSQATPSSQTSNVAAAPTTPVNTVAPTISYTAPLSAGSTITAGNGTWTNTPTGYAYQWQRFDGTSWVDISGATSNTYLVSTADNAATLRVRVSASNASGASPYVPSAASSVVTSSAVVGVTIDTPSKGTILTNPSVHVVALVSSSQGIGVGYSGIQANWDGGAWVPLGLTDAAGGQYEGDVLLSGPDGDHTLTVAATF